MLQRGMLLYAQVPNYLSPYSVAYVATSQSPLLYKGKGYSEGHPLASLAKRLHLPPPPRQPLPYGQPPWRNKPPPRTIARRATMRRRRAAPAAAACCHRKSCDLRRGRYVASAVAQLRLAFFPLLSTAGVLKSCLAWLDCITDHVQVVGGSMAVFCCRRRRRRRSHCRGAPLPPPRRLLSSYALTVVV